MKKIILIAIAFILSFTSCSLEDKIEDAVNDKISTIEQEISEEFIIPALAKGERSVDPTTIDTSVLQKQIDQVNGNSSVSIDDITLDELEITIITEGATFDFLNSIEVILLNENGENKTLANFNDIPEGATSLKLPEDDNINGLESLLEEDGFKLGFNLDVKDDLTEQIELELISNFLIDIDFSL